jgi:signal transduction histidine kinase
MDASTLDRLFRIEDKLSTHGTSGERGSGMGLILSQSLAERNRGSIAMESSPGVGTTATLWLPLSTS